MANVKKILNDGVNLASKGVKAGAEAANNAKNEIIKKLDVNGNGQVDIDDVINVESKYQEFKLTEKNF